jgi:hypothetical protein
MSLIFLFCVIVNAKQLGLKKENEKVGKKKGRKKIKKISF